MSDKQAKTRTNWDVLVERVSANRVFDSVVVKYVRANRVLVSVGVALSLVLAVVIYSSIGGESEAPDFTLTDTNGQQFKLSDYWNNDKVLIIDFMYTTCPPCNKFAEDTLEPYLRDKPSDVAILSISVFGKDDADELQSFAEDLGWRHALGDKEGKIELAYKVTATPKLFIIDNQGRMTFEHVGGVSLDELDEEVEKARSGSGSLVKVKETSIYLFAIAAGFALFFSPCAFPLLPGFMSYYLTSRQRRRGGFEVTEGGLQPVSGFDERKAREALPAGLAAASGLVGVLLLIGILLIPLINVIGDFVPLLELVVGIVILVMGIAMVRNVSLEPALAPLRRGVACVSAQVALVTKGRVSHAAERAIRAVTRSDFTFAQSRENGLMGLFWYGVGYGSAAAGCVAPILVGLLAASLELSLFTGFVVFILFSATAGVLMVSFTMLVAASEGTIVNKLRASTHQIQVAGGVVMIIVGAYLIYYYLSL